MARVWNTKRPKHMIVATTSGKQIVPVPPKKRKWKPGTVALREIKKQQKSVDTIIPKAAIERVFRQLSSTEFLKRLWTQQAIRALHEAAEAYLIEYFGDAQMMAIHAGRIGIQPGDGQAGKRLKEAIINKHNNS